MSNKPRNHHRSDFELLQSIRGEPVRPAQQHRMKVNYRRHEKHRQNWREESNDE